MFMSAHQTNFTGSTSANTVINNYSGLPPDFSYISSPIPVNLDTIYDPPIIRLVESTWNRIFFIIKNSSWLFKYYGDICTIWAIIFIILK